MLIRLMFVKHEAIKIKNECLLPLNTGINYQISKKISYKTTIHSISNHYYIVFSVISI